MTRWLKNLEATSVEKQTLGLALFMEHCLEWDLVYQSAGWAQIVNASAADGIISTASPKIFSTTAGWFGIGDVGKWLVIKDNSSGTREDKDITLYEIDSYISPTQIQLKDPCDFQADDTQIPWLLVDPSTVPAADSYVILEAENGFQVRLKARATPHSGVAFETSPLGGFDSGDFQETSLGYVNISVNAYEIFALGDNTHCFAWGPEPGPAPVSCGFVSGAVVDGDMEAVGIGDWTVITGSASKNSSIYFEGTQSLEITGEVESSPFVGLTTGVDYTLSFRVSFPAATYSTAQILAIVDNGTDQSIIGIDPGVWNYYSIPFTKGLNNATITFRSYDSVYSTIYVDQVEISDCACELTSVPGIVPDADMEDVGVTHWHVWVTVGSGNTYQKSVFSHSGSQSLELSTGGAPTNAIAIRSDYDLEFEHGHEYVVSFWAYNNSGDSARASIVDSGGFQDSLIRIPSTGTWTQYFINFEAKESKASSGGSHLHFSIVGDTNTVYFDDVETWKSSCSHQKREILINGAVPDGNMELPYEVGSPHWNLLVGASSASLDRKVGSSTINGSGAVNGSFVNYINLASSATALVLYSEPFVGLEDGEDYVCRSYIYNPVYASSYNLEARVYDGSSWHITQTPDWAVTGFFPVTIPFTKQAGSASWEYEIAPPYTGSSEDISVDSVNVYRVNDGVDPCGDLSGAIVDGDMAAVGTTNWTDFGGVTVTKDALAHSGSQSLKIDAGGGSVDGGVVSDPFIGLVDGDDYTLKFWAFLAGDDDGYAEAVLDDGDQINVVNIDMGGWSFHTIPFVKGSGNATITFYLRESAGGDALYVDDVEITSCGCPYTEMPGLVPDGDMEAVGTTNWTFSGTGSIAKDNIIVHDGTNSLKCTTTAASSLKSDPFTGLTQDAEYVCEFWVYTTASGNIQARISPQGRVASYNQWTPISNSWSVGAWDRYEIHFHAESSSSQLEITVDGSNLFYLDDVTITSSPCTQSTLYLPVDGYTYDGNAERTDVAFWSSLSGTPTKTKILGTYQWDGLRCIQLQAAAPATVRVSLSWGMDGRNYICSFVVNSNTSLPTTVKLYTGGSYIQTLVIPPGNGYVRGTIPFTRSGSTYFDIELDTGADIYVDGVEVGYLRNVGYPMSSTPAPGDPEVSAIYTGNLVPINSGDVVPVVSLGSDSATPVLSRDMTDSNSFSQGGKGLYVDNTTVLGSYLCNWIDPSLADGWERGATNPRTGSVDSSQFFVTHRALSPLGNLSKIIRGLAQSLYLTGPNSYQTLVESGAILVLKDGIAVIWDGSTPI